MYLVTCNNSHKSYLIALLGRENTRALPFSQSISSLTLWNLVIILKHHFLAYQPNFDSSSLN